MGADALNPYLTTRSAIFIGLGPLTPEDQEKDYGECDEAPESDSDDAFDAPDFGRTLGRVFGTPIDAVSPETQDERGDNRCRNAGRFQTFPPNLVGKQHSRTAVPFGHDRFPSSRLTRDLRPGL